MYALNLRRNDGDNRPESWRVADESHPTTTEWNRAPEVTTTGVLKWLRSRKVPSIKMLNTCKLSLGVLHIPADKWEGFAVERSTKKTTEVHASLFEDLAHQPSEVNRAKYAPYIRFKDEDGEYDLQVREWGAYLLLSNPKYVDKPDALWTANGYKRGCDLTLVIGNMANHRNNWLIIKTFDTTPKPASASLFDGLSEEDGEE